MNTDNLSRQFEEIEALSSIYGSDWSTDTQTCHNVIIRENKMEVVLQLIFPPDYPEQSPPKYDIHSPMLDRKVKEDIHQALDEVYLENVGETVIYQWVEKVREILLSIKHPKKVKEKPTEIVEIEDSISKLDIKCPEIITGEVIKDRKSIFQGHCAVVHSIDEVKAVINKLLENKKIANATHNMYAYRIEVDRAGTKATLQDCDDDGEQHAGGRLAHLLQILNQKDVVVVVSRWYGGVQLGPDRFRHINNAARQVLTQAELIKN